MRSRILAATALSLMFAAAAFSDNAITEHQATIGGKSIRYSAEAGYLNVKTGPKQPEAQLFFIAYTTLPRDPKRPVTFFFNGGPGSSAVWLHMGAFGPKRVPLDANGMPVDRGAPQAVANEYSLLDLTDMVFLDPVSTGLSKANPAEDASKFHEVGMDIDVTAEFIRMYLAREKRAASPLYVGGESYGTIRAAAVVDVLQRRFSMPVTGTLLISPAINTQIYRIGQGNELTYVLSLPALAATAWYHKRIGAELRDAAFETVIAKATEFAKGRFARALFEGAALPEAERKAVAAELAKFIGLPVDEVLLRDLRINGFDYATLLLKDQKKTLGVLDGRYVGYQNDFPAHLFAPESSYAFVDASFAVDPVFATAFNDYLANELKFATTESYDLLSENVAQSWDWGKRASNQYLYTAANLRAAMTMHPAMKLFVANGYYDMVTPHLAAEYQINHLGIDPELRKNIHMHFYPSGHMMYVHEESMRQMKRDLANFY